MSLTGYNVNAKNNIILGTLNTVTLTNSGGVTGTFSFPSGNTTLVGETSSHVFTNKTITDSTNTVTATGLRTNSGTVSISGATAPSTGQVLVATGNTGASWQNVSGLPTSVTCTSSGTGSSVLATISIANNTVLSIDMTISAYSTTVLVGTSASFRLHTAYKNISSTVTQVGPSDILFSFTETGSSTWTVYSSAGVGGTVLINVTAGSLGNGIDWSGSYTICTSQ